MIIVVGIDESESAKIGLRRAIGMAETLGGELHVARGAFAVVAYDANGEVIHNQGRGTDAIVTCHPLPSTPLWSMLAVAASRLGCGVAAKRASGVVHARFVSTAASIVSSVEACSAAVRPSLCRATSPSTITGAVGV